MKITQTLLTWKAEHTEEEWIELSLEDIRIIAFDILASDGHKPTLMDDIDEMAEEILRVYDQMTS